MASLINKPLTSVCNSIKTNLCPETGFLKRGRSGLTSLSVRKSSGKVSFPILCKAVSVKAQTAIIEGLNIAEDVTQVRETVNLFFASIH